METKDLFLRAWQESDADALCYSILKEEWR